MTITHHLEKLSAIVADTFGWDFSGDRLADLERGLRETAKERGIELDSKDFDTWVSHFFLSRRGLDVLSTHLTVGETYFFREKQWLDLFQYQVIPDFLKSRQGKERRLRLWSAGCCSGEEPYSLAIILDKAIPKTDNWDITILGTDINSGYLKKAEGGIYTSWSFRETLPCDKEKYFLPCGKGWQIDPRIRNRVSFSRLNLASEDYPSAANNTDRMDVIFCRNVLMYFTTEQIKRVVKRFYHSLNENGLLFISAVELNNEYFTGFEPVRVGSCTIYRKQSGQKMSSVSISSGQVKPLRTVVSGMKPNHGGTPARCSDPGFPLVGRGLEELEITNARASFTEARYEQCAVTCESALRKSPGNNELLVMLVRSKANLGLLEEAKFWAEKLVLQPDTNSDDFYLLANILFEQKEFSSAENILTKGLFLDPDHLMSHLLLGNIANRHLNRKKAGRHFETAVKLLSRFRDDETVRGADGMTAGRLRKVLLNQK
jgi:chemotaxis protein methyltransferase CheR